MTNAGVSPDAAEAGFIRMSHYADALDGPDSNRKADALDDEGPLQASEFQSLLLDEIRARPLRAVGWAAVAGLALGLWAAR
ncbi:MAG: hypothetical protein DCF30_10575 [Hyphomicrobiales bacterium]|nr:MAG: hypothetical protein DCF30_10575 [Hyphomicrobiales bacterium]